MKKLLSIPILFALVFACLLPFAQAGSTDSAKDIYEQLLTEFGYGNYAGVIHIYEVDLQNRPLSEQGKDSTLYYYYAKAFMCIENSDSRDLAEANRLVSLLPEDFQDTVAFRNYVQGLEYEQRGMYELAREKYLQAGYFYDSLRRADALPTPVLTPRPTAVPTPVPTPVPTQRPTATSALFRQPTATPRPTATPKPDAYARVVTNTVNIRATATTDRAGSVGRVQKNEIVRVLDRVTNAEGVFWHIETKSGLVGFIPETYATAYTNSDAASLFKSQTLYTPPANPTAARASGSGSGSGSGSSPTVITQPAADANYTIYIWTDGAGDFRATRSSGTQPTARHVYLLGGIVFENYQAVRATTGNIPDDVYHFFAFEYGR